MNKSRIIEKLKLPNVFALLLTVFVSCALLIVINYYTIKILSINRAYINGESHYSKGQKEAVRHLTAYLYNQEETLWKLFQKELKIPQGDGIARVALINNGNETVIKKGLRAGGNNEKDLDGIIWLFKHFHSVSFFKKAVDEWEKGDLLINQLSVIGNQAHQKIQSSNLDSETRDKILAQISLLSDRLSIIQRNYSNTLSDGTRKIENYLIFTNVFFILIILSSVAVYYSVMIKKLLLSKKEIEIQNDNLIIANQELDKFVYSASHDLRSPITSLKGLITIAQDEENPVQIKNYLHMMYQSLTKQDQFINDIIDYSRNKRKQLLIEPVSLNKLIDDAVNQHQHIKNTNAITFKKDIAIDEITSDSLRLKIILNNLISNAIKYSDQKKTEKKICIKTYEKDGFYYIAIEDNGIGIREEFKTKIFEMFFVTNNNIGSGLGLYIAKEAVENLDGGISVSTTINLGSTFTVTLPKKYEI